MSENQKACYRCGELKVLNDFPIRKDLRDGHANLCKTCNRDQVKKCREKIKKMKEEDPIEKLKVQHDEIWNEIKSCSMERYAELEPIFRDLKCQIHNQPTDTFFIPTTVFGERSSMGDVIVMSRLPLFINQTLKKILMPQQLEIGFNTDFSQVRVKLPQDIRFTRAQIDEFTQILIRETPKN